MKNGVVRNCAHLRDSASSGLSDRSGRIIRPGAGSRSSTPASSNQVQINIQPPTPTSSPELDSRRKSYRTASVHSTDTVVGSKRQSVKLRRRETLPAILRSGYVVDHRGDWTVAHNGGVIRSSVYLPRSSLPSTAIADIGVDLSIRAGDAVQGSRLHCQNAIRKNPSSDDDRSSSRQTAGISEAIMQDWGEWSVKWGNLVTGAGSDRDNSGRTDRLLCDSDSLMREWREWSENWERSLRGMDHF